ncbi:hypothetical protein WR25_02314 [Diploscapter pachys]|uniref:Uncharacterized protein n=1 Tax=Diploscapter pachys TaxID=2018661 RepID=A0A2A2LC89_9BILA|nr:hypothetical protein WR25_02314 [Diploscapter pachys]
MLLKSSTADILLRLNRLEMAFDNAASVRREPQLESHKPLPPRSSQSAYAISNGQSTPKSSTMSKSLYVPSSSGKMHEDSPRPSSMTREESRRSGQSIVNVPVGKSSRGSPMRRWMSNHEVADNNQSRRSSIESSPSRGRGLSATGHQSPGPSSGRTTPTIPAGSLFASSTDRSNLHVPKTSPSTTIKRSSSANPKEPTLNSSNSTLQLHINGRPVSIPIPTEYKSLNPIADQDAPKIKPPKLEYAYGFRGKDVRDNLHSLPTGELVFFAGNVVVLMNSDEGTQRFYEEHTSDVRCIAIHPNRLLIASGQATRHTPDKALLEHRAPITTTEQLEKQLEEAHTEAHIRIWDSVTLSTVKIIGGYKAIFDRGIASMSFSQTDGGNLLSVIDEAHQHSLSVWNWQLKEKIAEAKAANDAIYGVRFHPHQKNLLIVYGKGHFTIWILEPKNRVLHKHSISFEGRDKPKSVLSLCFAEDGQIVTGDSNGTISVWDSVNGAMKIIKQAHNVHPGGVYALSKTKKESIISAGKDGVISEWNVEDLVRVRRPVDLPDDCGVPRRILQHYGQFYLSTSNNSLLSGTFEGGFSQIISGDAGDVTCCATLASGAFIACSASGNVKRWNTIEKKCDWSKNFGDSIECCSIDHTSTLLLIGCTSGQWSFIDLSSKEQITGNKESTQPITCVQFSPNGVLFFVATKELSAQIYRLDASRRFHQAIRIGSLPSWIQSADWDAESKFIRANTSVGHYIVWNASSGETPDVSAARDLEWATTNCRISFETSLLVHSTNGISKVCRSQNNSLIYAGKEDGAIRVLECPVKSVTAGYHEIRGHSNTINSLLALSANKFISNGIADCSLFQWSHEDSF